MAAVDAEARATANNCQLTSVKAIACRSFGQDLARVNWYTAIDDYNPKLDLDKIRAKVFAVNFADDLLNPVHHGNLAELMPNVASGKFVIVSEGPDTIGHQTLTLGKVWAPYLSQLIESLPK